MLENFGAYDNVPSISAIALNHLGSIANCVDAFTAFYIDSEIFCRLHGTQRGT